MPAAELRIGVDFDNTIVCHDPLFHRLAVEQKLIPPEVPSRKSDVRDYLRRIGREEQWTELQGQVYGERLGEAQAFPGVREFFARCVRRGVPVVIISHRTRYPFLGPRCDLLEAARAWLERQGFFDARAIGLARGAAYFELTKEEKMQRIAALGCTHFIDDLPELLQHPEFPAGVQRILFVPEATTGSASAPGSVSAGIVRGRGWNEIGALLLDGGGAAP